MKNYQEISNSYQIKKNVVILSKKPSECKFLNDLIFFFKKSQKIVWIMQSFFLIKKIWKTVILNAVRTNLLEKISI